MAGGVVRPVVLVAQLSLDNDQIFDVKFCRIRLLAASTNCMLTLLTDVLVKFYGKLRRPLENVEELSERQPQDSKDHGHGVRDREKLISVTLQPRVTDRQQQTRNANGKQEE
jgi:hypothetical protein